eukprot:142808-Pleurochrysis_carterae.AAC.1
MRAQLDVFPVLLFNELRATQVGGAGVAVRVSGVNVYAAVRLPRDGLSAKGLPGPAGGDARGAGQLRLHLVAAALGEADVIGRTKPSRNAVPVHSHRPLSSHAPFSWKHTGKAYVHLQCGMRDLCLVTRSRTTLAVL